MELIDTHCHLNHPAYADDREQTLERAQTAGITRFLCIGYDLESSRSAVELAQREEIYAAIGIHPESADEWSAAVAEDLRVLFQRGKVAAYGEIGLDYHWETVPKERQQSVFREQIAFAQTLSPNLPLIIHNRDALADTLAMIQASATDAPVVMHCFTGDVEAARECLEAGCFLGIGGAATFKKSETLRAAVAYAPLDRLLLETDCPYLAPQGQRGRRNEPSYLPIIAEIVSSAKGLSLEEVAAATSANARALFGM